MINPTFLEKTILEDLQKKYNKSALSRKELAHELGISLSTIDKNMKRGEGIPQFIKLPGEKGKVLFPLVCVAHFLSNTIKVQY